MMQNPKTNLFVIGAMKAGTTSFIEMLTTHQDIYVPPIKEPHFFIDKLPKWIYEPSRFFSLNKYFAQEFPKPLHITKIKTKQQYQQLFSLHQNQKYALDASTCYLSAPESCELIHRYNPEAKIIVLTRNPLDRAFSHFTMNVGLGREPRSFDKAITEEITAYKKQQLPWYSYINMSLYDTPINRYKNHFNHVLVLNFEELYSRKEETLRKVSEFLKVDDFPSIKTVHKNKSRQIKFQKLFYLLKKLGLKDYFSMLFSQSMRQKIFHVVSTEKKDSPVLQPETQSGWDAIVNDQ